MFMLHTHNLQDSNLFIPICNVAPIAKILKEETEEKVKTGYNHFKF